MEFINKQQQQQQMEYLYSTHVTWYHFSTQLKMYFGLLKYNDFPKQNLVEKKS